MKKIFVFLIVAIAFMIPCHAEEINEDIMSNFSSELSDFKDSLPESVRAMLPNELFEGDFSSLSEYASVTGIFNSILDQVGLYLPDILKTFSYLLILILISSIFNNIKNSFESESLKSSFSLISALCISVSVFTSVLSICKYATAYMKILCNVINAFIPIMIGMYILNGNVSSATVSSTSLLFFISIIENFIVIYLLPISKMCIFFGVVTSVNPTVDLSGISRTVKNTFVSVSGFCMMVFSFGFSMQHTLSQSADSLSLRTAKLAVGSWIPVVGNATTEAMKTVFSSISFLKNSCGILCIVCIALITLPVIVSVFLNKLCLNICSGISNALSSDNEAKIFNEASTVCGFILAIVFLTSIMFIFALTLFIKSGVNVS